MAKDNNEIKLTKSEKKKLKDSIYDEIKEDLTIEISKSILNEVQNSLNSEYKDDLKEKITNEISDDIKNSIRKEESKLSRKKDFKIFRLYIYIILLIVLFGFVFYKLYKTNHLNDLVPESIKIPEVVSNTNETTTTSVNLIDKYSYLLNNIKVSDSNLLNGEFKEKDIKNKEKLKLAYNNLSSDSISIEGAIYIVSSNDLKESFNKLFTTEYTPEDFKINNIDFKYSTKTDSFIAIPSNEAEKEEYIFEVESIDEDSDYIYINTITALNKNGYIYNINNLDSSVAKYKESIKLSKYKSDLTRNRIIFTKSGEKLYAITKI